jgi:hypothetical protein
MKIFYHILFAAALIVLLLCCGFNMKKEKKAWNDNLEKVVQLRTTKGWSHNFYEMIYQGHLYFALDSSPFLHSEGCFCKTNR